MCREGLEEIWVGMSTSDILVVVTSEDVFQCWMEAEYFLSNFFIKKISFFIIDLTFF